MSDVRSVAASASFNLFEMTPVETGGDPYYVLWKDGDVVARGSLDTMKRSLQGWRNDLDGIPRFWELPGYNDD